MKLPPDAPTPCEANPARRWTFFSHLDTDRNGAVLGDRFEIGELLGAGGTSWVYACRDRLLSNVAAVKILKEGTDDARRRFFHEGRILGSLRHPHLVQLLALGETDAKEPFMVLELLPGRSLDQRLIDDGPLPWREVAELVAQAAEALDALHRAGVIHRDVKPSNIVQLSGATDQPLVKLIDVGIAKVEDWARIQGGGFTPPPRHQTDTGLIVGTPGFQPPEVSRTKPTPRFDTFALGVTIFMLCTGVMPDLMVPRRMNEVRPECGAPPELEALVAGALALDPEQRIGSAAEIKARLDSIRHAHANASSPYLFEDCYELLEVLGVGAKAEVHRAYHMEEARYVALKLLSVQARKDPEECVRFAREAKALSVTRHPALPELVECRTSPRRAQPYIAMALARGKRASEFCVEPRCLGPVDVISVGKQLAGALAALHANGILHRDLHGSNVLIEVGQRTTATLIDIGMAEYMDAFYAAVDQRYPTPPEHRRKLGTGGVEQFEWTAPEARANKVWSEKCDVYSLGLLLYKLLTGKQPRRGKTRELVSPREYVPGCPVALSSALLGALQDDPAERVDLAALIAKLDAAADEMSDGGEEDEDVELASEAAAQAPPVVTPGPRRRPWARSAAATAAGFTSLALAWWAGRATTPPVPAGAPAPVFAAVTDAPRPDAGTPPVPTSVPAPVFAAATDTPRPDAIPVRPPVDGTRTIVQTEKQPVSEAIDDVADELRTCASRAGGTLLLELTAKGERLTDIAVQGAHEKPILDCVHGVLDPLRFAPTPEQFFSKEYTP